MSAEVRSPLRIQPSHPAGRRKPSPEPLSGDDVPAGADPRRWAGLVVVLAAAFLGVLDFFIVNVSIPSIQSGLGASFGQIQLVIAGYGLAYAVLLITGGRLGDLYGRKRMFRLGVAGFTLASALCGLAQDPVTLIAARVLQGATGAVMFPQVLSIIQVGFPPGERGRAFGLLGAVMGAASFSGNVLGGVLVEADLFGLAWRPIFLVNLPVGLLALLASGPLVRESRAGRAARPDLVGLALASPGLFLLVYPLVQGREAGWPPWAFVSLAVAGVLLTVFAWYEGRLADRGGTPLVDPALFRDRAFVTGLLTTFAFYGGLSAFFLSFTLFLQDGLGLSPREAGFTFAPFAVGFLAASFLAVKLAARLGRGTIQLGAALMATALAAVTLLAAVRGLGLHATEMAPLLLLYGTGQGLVMPTLLAVVLGSVPTESAGSASGVLTTSQQVALAVGVAVIGTVFFGVLGPHPRAVAFPGAIETSLWCNIGLLAATFGLVFLLPRHPGTVAHPVVEM